MRIVPGKPFEIVRSAVNDYLVRVCPDPGEVAWLHDRSLPPPDVIRVFSDSSLVHQVDPAALNNRLRLATDQHATNAFNIVAGIGSDIRTNATFLLTDEGRIVFITETTSSVSNNVVQIAGAEPTLFLMTPTQIHAQTGKKLMRDGTTIRLLSLQQRNAAGEWARHPDLTFELPNGATLKMP